MFPVGIAKYKLWFSMGSTVTGAKTSECAPTEEPDGAGDGVQLKLVGVRVDFGSTHFLNTARATQRNNRSRLRLQLVLERSGDVYKRQHIPTVQSGK